MAQVRTSIIIPTYNRSSTIHRAIRSCLKQTSENLEIIVVDDGSTDNTPQVVRNEYSDNIRYLRYEKNRGANFARTVGAANANGTYISFLDSDDEFHPEHVEKVRKRLDREDDDYAGVVVSNTRIVNGEARSVRHVRNGCINSKNILDGETLNGFSSLTIKADVLKELLPLDDKLPGSQELDLYIRLAKQGYNLLGIGESLVNYHIEGNQISENTTKQITGRKRILQKHSNEMSDNYCSELYYGIAFLYCRNNDMKDCRNALRKAVKYNPEFKYIVHYFASLFGENVFSLLLKVKRSVRI